MKALQLVAAGRPLEEVELPRPGPGPGEVVLDVEAAGICHSDVHYRSGLADIGQLPVTLGHEVAGIISAVGEGVDQGRIGTRVGIHYVVSCGNCDACLRRGEQFCDRYQMIGENLNGGYAEALVVPSRNAVELPDGVDVGHAAIMMCSSATALHNLRRGGVRDGDVVAVFGVGGLGMSAVQLARTLGASAVFGVDIDEQRLNQAEALGATPVQSSQAQEAILAAGGADVALDLVGSVSLLRTALDSMAPGGRVVSVGLTNDSMKINPLQDLIFGELALLGSNDHHLSEIHELLEFAGSGHLLLDGVISEYLPLEPGAVNEAMDEIERFRPGGRRVIRP